MTEHDILSLIPRILALRRQERARPGLAIVRRWMQRRVRAWIEAQP